MIIIKCSSCGFTIFTWSSKDNSIVNFINNLKKNLYVIELNGRTYIVCPCCLSPLNINPKTLEIEPIEYTVKPRK